MTVTDKVKSFNFEFIKSTRLEKYYDILLEDEIALYRSPTDEKIFIDSRLIIEELVADLLLNDLNEDGIYNDLVDNIEILYRKGIIPEDINYKLNRIRKASNNFAHPNADSIDTPEYILILLRECLKWYLDYLKIVTLNEYEDFIKPDYSSIENYGLVYDNILKKYEKLKEKYDSDLKKKEIRFGELKKNKDDKNEENNKELLEARKLIRIYDAKEDEVKKLISDTEDSIRFLENLAKDLKNKEIISGIDKIIEDARKNIIRIREKESFLIEKIRILEDKVLEGIDLKENIEFADKISYEIKKDIESIRLVVRKTSKEILDIKDLDKIEYEAIEYSRYPEFFKGFLKVKGERLKNSYIFLEKIGLKNILEYKVNGKFSKDSTQKLEKYIYNENLKLVAFSDDEIKLKLYYSLMKYSKVNEGSLLNERDFKINLDIVVEEAYSAIETNKDFYCGEDKLADIISYYLGKISKNLSVEFLKVDVETQEKIVNIIFNSLEELPKSQREKLYSDLELVDPTEARVKSKIRSGGLLDLLKSLIKMGTYTYYITYISVIYNTLKILGFKFPFTAYPGGDAFISYLTGPYLMQLLINEGHLFFESKKKKRFELISILVLNISLAEILDKNQEEEEKGYCRLKEAWIDVYNNYVSMQNRMDLLIENKDAIKSIQEELENKILGYKEIIEEKKRILKKQKKELKEVILESNRLELLDGYFDYNKDLDKLKNFIFARNYNRKTGALKRLAFKAKNELRIRVTKGDIRKYEEKFVELAIASPHFEFETELVRLTLDDIENEKLLIENTNEEIRKYNEDYRELRKEEKELNRNINSIRKEYFDIDFA